MTQKKTDVWQGTLAIMVLKTLEMLGPLHGYGIARRIEQTSGNLLSVRDAPLRCDISLLLQFEQGRVERPLLDLKHVIGELLDALPYPIAVHRPK